MKTTNSLILILAFSSSLVFAQEQKDIDKSNLIKSDIENAKKADMEKKEEMKNEKAAENKTQDQKSTLQKPSISSDAVNENASMIAYMTPGQMHKVLASAAGEWDLNVSYWKNPAEAPIVSKSKCSISMILGGRYQKSVSKGKMSEMNFEGQGIIGYDNVLNKFQSTWIDNMGTGTLVMTGTYNEKINMFEFIGKMTDPISRKEIETIQTTKIENPNSMKMEMSVVKNGVKNRVMEITYSRIIAKKK